MKLTYTVHEAAAIIGVNPHTIYNDIKRGTCQLQYIKVGNRILITKPSLERALGITLDQPA